MSQIKTYPEMNETIKDLLRRSEEPMQLYILARIEGLEKQVSALTHPLNDPLTLGQLREMDGEPVWISYVNSAKGKYHIVRAFGPNSIIFDEYDKEFGPYKSLFLGNYGKTWLAYRRRPEEGMA